MCFPNRRKPVMVRPSRRAATSSGRPPAALGAKNRASTIRRPATNGASDRTTVSTSGSSGKLGQFDEHLVAFHFNGEALQLDVGVDVVLSGRTAVFPAVPRADEVAVFDVALAQRAPLVRANAQERVHPSSHVADRDRGLAMLELHDRVGLESGDGGDANQ